jgi:osmotically-inducible protein OsmY
MTTFNRSYLRRTGGAAFVAVLISGASAFADDAVLRQRIETRLSKAGLDQRGQVDVEVKNGSAVLSGFTVTVDAQRAAEKAAHKETKTVVNRIRVVSERKNDAEIEKAVAAVILREPYYGVFDSVGIAVDQGAVLLRGSVNRPWLKDALDNQVAQVPGVTQITNEIDIQPTSLFDDRLRTQLYRRIYGNGLFDRYAHLAIPPVRIIVVNGKVTLTGIVNSKVEQAVLGSIANSTLSFKVDNQVQIESEMKKEKKAPSAVVPDFFI